MSFMLVDAVMAEKLDRADGSIELCTSDGRVLGYFSPAKPKKLSLECPLSKEEWTVVRKNLADHSKPFSQTWRSADEV